MNQFQSVMSYHWILVVLYCNGNGNIFYIIRIWYFTYRCYHNSCIFKINIYEYLWYIKDHICVLNYINGVPIGVVRDISHRM